MLINIVKTRIKRTKPEFAEVLNTEIIIRDTDALWMFSADVHGLVLPWAAETGMVSAYAHYISSSTSLCAEHVPLRDQGHLGTGTGHVPTSVERDLPAVTRGLRRTVGTAAHLGLHRPEERASLREEIELLSRSNC